MDVVDAVLNQYTKNTEKTDSKTDLTKYFGIFLPQGHKEGELRFRILTVKEGESPFREAWFHSLQIGGKWRKFYDPKKNDGHRSPLSEVADKLLSTGLLKDKNIAKQYQSKRYYILKGIDRNKESEGVKFWRFPHNYKGNGIFDKIAPLFKSYGNITDYKAGRDLIIYVGRDDRKNAIVNTVIVSDPCPLGTPEQMKEWLTDQLTWKDVFKNKPTEYLEIVAKGEEPIWSSELNKFISKDSTFNDVEDTASLEVGTPANGGASDDFEFDMNDLPF